MPVSESRYQCRCIFSPHSKLFTEAFPQKLLLGKNDTFIIQNENQTGKSAYLPRSEKEGDTELTRALTECVENYRRHNVTKMLGRESEEFFASPSWREFAIQRRNTLFKSLWNLWGSWLTRESLKEEFKHLLGRKT